MSRIHLGRRFYVHGRRIGWLAGKLKMRGWIAEASRHRRRRQNELPYNEKTTERYIRATRTEFHFYATLYISLPADVSVFDHRPPASFIINTRLFIIVIFLIRPRSSCVHVATCIYCFPSRLQKISGGNPPPSLLLAK